jgi:hypothetical protein
LAACPRWSHNPQGSSTKPSQEGSVELMSPDGWLMPRKQA